MKDANVFKLGKIELYRDTYSCLMEGKVNQELFRMACAELARHSGCPEIVVEECDSCDDNHAECWERYFRKIFLDKEMEWLTDGQDNQEREES